MFEDVGRGGAVAGVVGALALLASPVVLAAAVGAWWWLREPATAPPSAYAFELPPEAARAGGVDGLALHREQWPSWVLARDPATKAATLSSLTATVAHDPALVTLAGQLADGLERDPRAAYDAVDVWNAALGARGVPFALQAGGTAPHAYVKGYWLAAEPTVRVGDRRTTVRVGVRVDRLNIVEGWLGVAEDVGGAIVVVDRVRDFAVDDLWTRLDPADDRPLSAALRADVAARLPADAVAALAAAAPAQRALHAAVTAVQDRRGTCDSGFRLRVPWDGVDDFASLRAYADEYAGQRCPGITHAEVDALVAGTLAVRGDPALPAALERLVAYAARHVAVHEARHRLDHEDWGFGTPPPCGPCERWSPRATIEASAYLAALASPDAVVAVVQGCEVLASGAGGGSVTALERVWAVTGATCDGPLPPDLADRAAATARDWFGHGDQATVEGLPDQLPLGLRP